MILENQQLLITPSEVFTLSWLVLSPIASSYIFQAGVSSPAIVVSPNTSSVYSFAPYAYASVGA